jgi:soluble lytic murein transglycosylase-like protein
MNKEALAVGIGGLSIAAMLWALHGNAVAQGFTLNQSRIKEIALSTVIEHYPIVPADMIVVIASIESDFNPNAVRNEPRINDASTGLMQTLVSTAQWLWDDMGYRGFPRPTAASLLDPATSIYFGGAYLSYLFGYKGVFRSEQFVVESYNGGPGNSNTQTRQYWQKYLDRKETLL